MNLDGRYLDAILREDFYSFVQKTCQTLEPMQQLQGNWHLEAIAWHLKQCMTGNIRRLIITLPPRSLKSISASVAFPAYVLGHDPTKKILCISYSADLAVKNARECRAIMQSDWYRRLFPHTRLGARTAEHDFQTTQHGYRYTTSVCGTLTGRGGNIIIIDDPMKAEEALSDVRRKSVNEWFDNTLYSRLDNKKSDVIILIMQRLHMDDMVGHVLKKEPWVHLNLPAIARVDEEIATGPGRYYARKAGEALHGAREPTDLLEKIRETMGSFSFSAQYQQQPIPEDGQFFKWEWFKFYDEAPVRKASDRLVQSWDTASKDTELSDYSVCTTWLVREKEYYLLEVFRKKLLFPALRQAVYDQAAKYLGADLLIEDTAAGTALLQELHESRMPKTRRIRAIKPEGSKIVRASAQSAPVEAGRVRLPREAPWLEGLRDELMQFPNGQYDDQVDSITQFLKRETEKAATVRTVDIAGY